MMLMATNTPTPANSVVEVSVSGLRSTKGRVLACLTANAKFFPDCGKDPKAMKLAVAAGSAAALQFDDVPPGRYAIALIHDENANNKMDITLFLPREGFGFSRNPAIGMGPPKFASAQFVVSELIVKLPVKMKYML